MKRTMRELAQEAWDVQDACDLLALAERFGEVMKDLRALLPDAGTDELNNHHVARLWADKIAHLTSTQPHHGLDTLNEAYQWCREQVAS